jgi:hypothetical protein
VSGPYFAGLLSQKLGYAFRGRALLHARMHERNVRFPNAVIPQSAWSAPATNLLKYIPAPNNANGTFSTSAFNKPCATTKAPTASMPTRAGVCCPPTTFSTTGRRTIPIPVAQGRSERPGLQRALYRPRAIARPRRHENAERDRRE